MTENVSEPTKKKGRPPGIIFEKQYRVRMKADLWEDIERIAQETNSSVATVVRFALADFVEEYKTMMNYGREIT